MTRPLGTLPTTRSRVRTRALAASLLAVATLGVTAGCGSGSSSTVATDPASGPASDPAGHASRPPGVVRGAHVLPLVSITGGGGTVADTATALPSAADVTSFLAQFHLPAVRKHLRAVLDDKVGDTSHELYAQVVSVGCDRPPGVDVVVSSQGDVQLVPHEVASPLQECLAAVTTVAVAELPPA